MNRHTKIAIFIAPFLLIGGYIAADYYDRYQESQNNLFVLKLKQPCDLIKTSCKLVNEQLSLTISNHNGLTQIQANHDLDGIAFSLVDAENKETTYQMKKSTEDKIWQSETKLHSLLNQYSSTKLRLIASANKAYYFSEFYIRNN